MIFSLGGLHPNEKIIWQLFLLLQAHTEASQETGPTLQTHYSLLSLMLENSVDKLFLLLPSDCPSEHFPKHSVYTPQLVVNGKTETVGNNRNAVKNLVQKELSVIPAASLSIGEVTIGSNVMNFHYQTANSHEDEVLNIALVQKQVTTNVKAGENEGITIINHNIVRSFITQPLSNQGAVSISLPPAFKASAYMVVVFIQNKKDRSVKAALRKDL